MAMDGQAGCFPKPQPVPKITYPTNYSIILPAPCYRIGAPELEYAYFFTGLLLPVLATLFIQRRAIARFFRRVFEKIFVERCRRQDPADIDVTVNDISEAGSDVLESSRAAPDVIPSLNMLKRVRSLIERKSKVPLWHRYLNEMSSSQVPPGQILMGIGVFFSCVSLFIYLRYVNRHRDSLELCGTMPNVYQILDVIANSYLFVYFIIRLVGNPKKQKVATDLHAFGDYFCVPASVVGAALDRYFTGFTYFRIYNLMWIVEICANRGILRSANKTRLLKLLILVIFVVTVSAGFLHLAENLGDPWVYAPDGTPLYNGQSVVYWRCFLFIYGRITWLDLSGIRVVTHTGRIIVYAFQLIAMGIIGKAIPQIIQRIKIKPDYDKNYEPSSMFLHIVVCGHVTSSAMKAFLREFYHIDRYFAEHFKIIVLSDDPPDEAMDNLMERYFNKLEYKRGSVMRLKDLRRVNMCDAAATLILADRTATDADADDAANIMRVVSIKNLKGDARVIVQIAHYHNKAYLQNIPSWSTKSGDVIICIAELRLGLLAQNCQAPGFSTLMANLFTTRSLDAKTNVTDTKTTLSEDSGHFGPFARKRFPLLTAKILNRKFSETWMEDYAKGASLELYFRRLSPYFYGKTFLEACEFCFRRLKILMLAIQLDPEIYDSSPQIFPDPKTIIQPTTSAYFLADHRLDVQRAAVYCKYCHDDIADPEQITSCSCRAGIKSALKNRPGQNWIPSYAYDSVDDNVAILEKPTIQLNGDPVESRIWSYICEHPNTPLNNSREKLTVMQSTEDLDTVDSESSRPTALYDSSGLFYWTRARSLASVRLTRLQAARRNFANHIVLCVVSQPTSLTIGLASFVMPLRSSSIRECDLCDILILADDKYVEKEWKYLYNLPRLFVVKGSPLNRADLRSVNLNTCKMCVLIGAPNPNEKSTDPTLLDKSVILATLNVRAMKFSDDENIKADRHSSRSVISKESGPVKRCTRRTGFEVPLVTDLMRDTNVQFLDDDDEDLPGTEFYLTQPYSGGRAFSASVLDLLMVTSFFNPIIYTVLHSIIFGGASPELEQIMAEGAGLIGPSNITNREHGDQVRVKQIKMSEEIFSAHIGSTYGALFTDALLNKNLLLLGVYRKIEAKSDKRYVITAPVESFIAYESDRIFALQRTAD